MKEHSEKTGLDRKARNFEFNIILPDYTPYETSENVSGEYMFDDTGWEEPTGKIIYEAYDGEI